MPEIRLLLMIWSVCAALIASFLLTWVMRDYALRRDLLDHPNERSSHTQATPRGGGVAIVVSFLAITLFWYIIGDLPSHYFMGFFLAGGMVAGIGYWDDHGHIPARWRILVHFAAAALSILLMGGLPDLQLGLPWLDLPWFGGLVGVLFLVWLINLYNFMDGIDGIAGGEAIAVFAGAAVIALGTVQQPTDQQMAIISLQLAMAAAALGFLFWNWSPAKIFLGDIGSGFIGFIMGLFALIDIGLGLLSFWSWLILPGLFFVDATITLMWRVISGQRWYEAHRSHAYQKAAMHWRSHKMVSTGVIVIGTIWLLPLAWLATAYPGMGGWITAIALAPLFLLAIRLGAGVATDGLHGQLRDK